MARSSDFQPAAKSARMDHLGVEILTQIIQKSRLSTPELCALAILNREWKEACSSPCLWRELDLKAPQLTETALRQLSPRCSGLRELQISRDPCHPRALEISYSSSWLEGLTTILIASRISLRKLVLATGCSTYCKDYRSSLFYSQLMLRVAEHSKTLESIEMYYNAGKYGVRSEIPRWITKVIEGCPSIKHFSFWTPADCDGLEDKYLELMVKTWPDLTTAEVTGNDITLEGIIALRHSPKLKRLQVRYGTLGPRKRPLKMKDLEAAEIYYCNTAPSQDSPLEELELYSTNCDYLDLQILTLQFKNLATIRIVEVDDEDPDSQGSPRMEDMHGRAANREARGHTYQSLLSACLEDPKLSRLVSFCSF